MINDYPYAELFREHNVKKDMIIVDRTAQITPVSDHDPTIVGTYIFTSDDIKVESFDLTESLCSEDDIRFGLCTSSQVKITVKNKPEYPNLKDEVLKIYIYFNGDSDTLFEVGQYMVDTDAYSDDRRFRDLSMFDLLYFLRDYDITEWYNGIYADNNNQPLKISVLVNDLMRWLSADENIPITYDTLPQINYTIPKNVTADNITFGFFLQPLLEVLGLFGHIDRTGKVVYKSLEWYDKPAVRTVTDDWRKPPTTWKDQYTWGIGQIDVYDENNIRLFYYRNTDKKHPSIYTIADSFVFSSRKADDAEAKALLEYMWTKTTHIRYKPYEVKTIGDLCVEVGDRIDVQCGDVTFYTYVFERHLTGIQSMRDEYSARGNKKQPKHVIDKGSSYDDLNEGNSGIGTGGISLVHDDFDEELIEKDRNKGFRYLDEPNIIDAQYDSDTGKFKVKWEDPIDLIDNKPVQCIWAKTYVIKSDAEKPPKNIYQGTIVETSTTRDEYKTNWFEVTVEKNKRYYFALMPEDTKGDVRWTKVISLDTSEYVLAPTIISLEMNDSQVGVDVTYTIPSATYNYIKLVYKKGSIPASYSDGTAIDILQSSTSAEIAVALDGDIYFFVIFTDKSTSEPQNIKVPLVREIVLYDSTGSTVYIDERINSDDKWDIYSEYSYDYGKIRLRDGYIGQSSRNNVNNRSTTQAKFNISGYKYLCVTGENTDNLGPTNGRCFVVFSQNKPTDYTELYTLPHTENQYSPINTVSTKKVDISNLGFTEGYITIFGAITRYKVYKLWFEKEVT